MHVYITGLEKSQRSVEEGARFGTERHGAEGKGGPQATRLQLSLLRGLA